MPFRWHASYGVCAECGCYVNRRPPQQDALSGVYSLNDYWRHRQLSKGCPPIEKRSEAYRKDGRLAYWLSLVNRYGPSDGDVIEVGCAPGVLLSELRRLGFRCIGVEASETVAAWLRNTEGLDVRFGIFPGVELPACDLLLAFDVAEHTPVPAAFWTEIGRLLRPGGTAIIQTPIECHDFEHPFKTRPDWFDDVEHLFLYSEKSVRRLAALSGLQILTLEDTAPRLNLGQVCVLKKAG
ncbi:MAG: class I SAM-dependent methyltransferase [Terriglobia bacterium]